MNCHAWRNVDSYYWKFFFFFEMDTNFVGNQIAKKIIAFVIENNHWNLIFIEFWNVMRQWYLILKNLFLFAHYENDFIFCEKVFLWCNDQKMINFTNHEYYGDVEICLINNLMKLITIRIANFFRNLCNKSYNNAVLLRININFAKSSMYLYKKFH